MDTRTESPEQEEIRQLLLDPQLQAERHEFVAVTVNALTETASWIGTDSWLGGGKITDLGSSGQSDADTYPAFRAISTVIAMSAELAEAAGLMATRRRYYAVGALLRQLIECEYLLTLFVQDLTKATEWAASTPKQIRESFSPAKMRKQLKSFSDREYWRHCDRGGHPAPQGAALLESCDPVEEIWPHTAAVLLVDLGHHLRRIWKATDHLLEAHWTSPCLTDT